MAEILRYGNGLKVIVEHFPALRSAAVGIFAGVGSMREDEENNGLSHFTEHMMFKGTDKLTPFEIASAFENNGAIVNAFTSKECTCYYFKAVDEKVSDCFETLSHIFFDSTFRAAELDKERKVIVEEINMGEDDPADICYDLIARSLYGSHALARPIIGSIDNVDRFSGDDIRAFMRRYYRPDNVVVSFAGCVTLEQADSLVRRFMLERFSVYEPSDLPSVGTVAVKSGYTQRIKDFEQSNIAVAYPTIPFNDALSMTQSVLNLAVGGGMSSRLFQTIRERQGLAYSVYSAPAAYTDNGAFAVYLNITAANTARVCESVRREMEILRQEGITEVECERAKMQLKSALLFGQENCQSVMLAIGKLLLLCDELYDLDKRIAQINAVTAEAVNDFVRRFIVPDNVCAAYVGKAFDADIMKLLKE